MNYTEDQILALAPDSSSAKAGTALAKTAPWANTGADEEALWGECQGSGSKPYQTQIDLRQLAFKCSCPSRKFPCKHGLGLMLLHKKTGGFPNGQRPNWVTEWLSKRSEKAETKTEPTKKQPDEAAQQRRRQARLANMQDGVAELLLWIKDIVREGIMNLPEKGAGHTATIARRMIDAQAPGLAGLLREMGQINYFADNWQTTYLDKLAHLFLLATAFQQMEQQEEAMAREILTLAGLPQSKEQVLAGTGIADRWTVLGHQLEEEDNLTTEKYWLLGQQSNKYALLLNFYVPQQVREAPLMTGTSIDAELVYYNADLNYRALIKQQTATQPAVAPDGYANWNAVVQAQTAIISKSPFVTEMPAVVNGLLPVPANGQWWLQDANGMCMHLNTGCDVYKLAALSGGHLLPIVVVGKGHTYLPLGTWHNGTFTKL